ncbi:MAG: TIGR02996 domain-containing protein [Gemmataceae bacterium]
MTDALLAAVLAAPDDDLPRLVFADHLDEAGDPVRAEFVRVQVALHGRADPPVGLVARERTLLALHRESWLAPLKVRGEALFSPRTHGVFVRGFVGQVWMPAAVFIRKAGKLFARAPVQELRVTQATAAELADLTADPLVARLRALDLSDTRLGDPAARLLSVRPVLAGLRTLRLRQCQLTDTGAGLLADAEFDWPLAELDVSLNPLSADGLAALRKRFGAAVRWDLA